MQAMECEFHGIKFNLIIVEARTISAEVCEAQRRAPTQRENIEILDHICVIWKVIDAYFTFENCLIVVVNDNDDWSDILRTNVMGILNASASN